MRSLILTAFLFASLFTRAQVGIGTNTPSTNAVLDVNSSNKGLMLPRLNDTFNVSNPSAGLMIYNSNTRTPAFHNGTRWNNIASQSTTFAADNVDSITYTVTNAVNGFANGTFRVFSLSNGLSNSQYIGGTGGIVNFQDISLALPLDLNTIAFAKAVATGSIQSGMVIEFKFYVPNALPAYSIKAISFIVSSFSTGGSSNAELAYNISISPTIYGYKNWVSNISFGWNRLTNLAGPY
jgi:hypothetical protein